MMCVAFLAQNTSQEPNVLVILYVSHTTFASNVYELNDFP